MHAEIDSSINRRIFSAMASGQQFLFAPDKPLVKRLGNKFFKTVPQHAGVYKMRDAQDNIIYVGKARNLRQRLRSYRIANPERLSRRHLRLLQQATRIEFDLCPSEQAALKHEARLIRTLKPKFNRAGVWQGKPRFLVWRFVETHLELDTQEVPLPGWERYGSLGAYASRLRGILARTLWLAMNPDAGIHQLPYGWMHSNFTDTTHIHCAGRVELLKAILADAFWGNHEAILDWMEIRIAKSPAFERVCLSKDLEELREFFEQQVGSAKRTSQMILL